MSKSIEIIVSPSGDITIDAVGFKGADCEKATKFLEEALGLANRKIKKPEFHHQNITQQRIGS